ncbi:hypothetical protein YC2023_079838 [Brassica napus]
MLSKSPKEMMFNPILSSSMFSSKSVHAITMKGRILLLLEKLCFLKRERGRRRRNISHVFWVVVVCAVPYILSYFSDSKDELKLDF